MQVVHLTAGHTAFDSRVFYKECRTLARAGYEVTLIVPHDREMVKDDVRIVPVMKPNNRYERFLKTSWVLYRRAIQYNADLYHFHDFTLIPVGILLKARGKRIIYDVHECYPLQITATRKAIPRPLKPILRYMLDVFERGASVAFDGIISVLPAISARFPERKTITLHNYASQEEVIEDTAREPYSQRAATVGYIGEIHETRGLDLVVDALSLLPASLDVKLEVAGVFKPTELKQTYERMSGWQRTTFVGWLDKDGARALLGKVRIGVCPANPKVLELYRTSYPSKLFEYMAAGIPAVVANVPPWRSIVYEANCGLVVSTDTPDGYAKAIRWLLENPAEARLMGESGRKAVLNTYNWEQEAAKLVTFYQTILPTGAKL